jgi:hypothetical protein
VARTVAATKHQSERLAGRGRVELIAFEDAACAVGAPCADGFDGKQRVL